VYQTALPVFAPSRVVEVKEATTPPLDSTSSMKSPKPVPTSV